MIKKIKYFLSTTLLGGLLVVMPVILLLVVLNWLFNIVFDVVEPLTYLIIQTARIHYLLSFFIAIAATLLIFFLVGLLIKTRIGKFIFVFIEENFLSKIPFYNIIKETVIQLFGTKKTLFSSVALVDLYGIGNLMTAFITDEHEDGSYTVFVPSGPAPTAGFVYHVKAEYVFKVDYPLDQAMRTIISLGSGSKKIIEQYNLNKNLKNK